LSKTEKVISLTGIDLLDFTGINEQKINFIRETFDDSVIIIRGDSLILKAEEKEIDTLTKVFEELMFLQKRQGSIGENDINLVLDLLDAGESTNKFKEKFGISNGDIKDIILFKKTDFVKPRTATQLEYYKQVQDNDIVFAIGPAGTGKTYLAVAFAVAALKNKLVNKIVLSRPAVEAGESLGFLPGDISEKVDPSQV